MSSAEPWREFECDDDAPVRVFQIVANTHSELGQTLLLDPLSVLLDRGVLESDTDWRAQVYIANAEIPSGPLPLPRDIKNPEEQAGQSAWLPPWVIRKHVVILMIYTDLKLVIAVVRRFGKTRQEVLEILEQSQSQPDES